MDIHVANDALRINDEDRALAVTFGAQDAIGFRYLSVRPKITEQWIGDAVQAVRPGGETGNMVYAYAQNLDI
jgi:hypothetical protein